MFSHLSLHRLLLKALAELNYRQPTPVQEQTIPLALEGLDLQVCAETGSGKTVAYLLPMLHRLLSRASPDAGCRALVLLPTRELAQQVFEGCQSLIKHTRLEAALLCGGEEFDAQARQLERRNPAIVIATTGRLVEHLDRGLVDLAALDVLVLDEADRMLDLGFSDEVLKIVAASPRQRQTLLFSATLSNKWLPFVARKVLQAPEIIEVSGGRAAHSNIHEQVILADDDEHKQKLVRWLLANEHYEKALIFVNSRAHADKLSGDFVRMKLRLAVLHGEVEQIKRNRVMALLREGKVNILIATDLAARGLDIDGVDLVINFEMARRGDDYIHRIGRTGRGEREGLAVTLIKSTEWNLKASIERYLKHRFEPRTISGLEANYRGPKKLKASGQAAKGKKSKKKKKKGDKKTKQRKRVRQNIGKRRKASAGSSAPGASS